MKGLIRAAVLSMATITAAAASPTNYALDAQDTLIDLKVFKDESALAAGMSHDHAVRAVAWSGTARIDPTDLASCIIDVVVLVAGLVVDELWMCRVAGLEGEFPTSMKASVLKNMLSADQLNIEEHTEMRFTATHCTPDRLSGDLTIRGVTQTIEMPSRIAVSPDGLTLSGRATILATDFGFEPFSAMMGALKNRNEMERSITLVGAADAAADAG